MILFLSDIDLFTVRNSLSGIGHRFNVSLFWCRLLSPLSHKEFTNNRSISSLGFQLYATILMVFVTSSITVSPAGVPGGVILYYLCTYLNNHMGYSWLLKHVYSGDCCYFLCTVPYSPGRIQYLGIVILEYLSIEHTNASFRCNVLSWLGINYFEGSGKTSKNRCKT